MIVFPTVCEIRIVSGRFYRISIWRIYVLNCLPFVIAVLNVFLSFANSLIIVLMKKKTIEEEKIRKIHTHFLFLFCIVLVTLVYNYIT